MNSRHVLFGKFFWARSVPCNYICNQMTLDIFEQGIIQLFSSISVFGGGDINLKLSFLLTVGNLVSHHFT